MVICRWIRRARQRAFLMTDLMVAMALLVLALLPLGYSIASEKRLARAYYERAVAMEIVDGEMEVLLNGGWRAFAPGTHPFAVRADAAANLPPGEFFVTLQPGTVRLEWKPAEKNHGGPVAREAALPPPPARTGATP